VIESLVQEELLVQQALADTTVQVPDQAVQTAVDEVVREVRSQFATELEFRRQLQVAGFGTPEEYRRYFFERRRREMLVQALLQTLQQQDKIRPIPPTEAEMRAYFEAARERQPVRPATVTFRTIVVRPEPRPAADTAARRLADSLRTRLTEGADFAQLARRYSGDSVSAAQGGELGWLRRGATVREFEGVVFALRPGRISPVFRSPFGYHIAEVQRTEPGEVQVRHILIAPAVTDADREAAEQTAQRLVAALRAGAPFDSLERRHHDPLEQSLFENVARTDLYPSIAAAIAEAAAGDILGPVEVTEGGRERWAVLRFDEARPEGRYTFEELRETLRRQLAEQNMYARYVQSLREATYVDIRI
jgi:peptidyl-prolyl cis-trans isomerase SurA